MVKQFEKGKWYRDTESPKALSSYLKFEKEDDRIIYFSREVNMSAHPWYTRDAEGYIRFAKPETFWEAPEFTPPEDVFEEGMWYTDVKNGEFATYLKFHSFNEHGLFFSDQRDYRGEKVHIYGRIKRGGLIPFSYRSVRHFTKAPDFKPIEER